MTPSRLVFAATPALFLAACGSTPGLPGSSEINGALLTTGSLGTDFASSAKPAAVYELIARRALACWFGAHGPLKATHTFHADVSPPEAGGQADIVLHERDRDQSSPRGARAFRVLLTPNGVTATHVEITNARLPDDLGNALRRDVTAWLAGGDGCEAQIVRPPAAPAAAAEKPSPASQRRRDPPGAKRAI